MLDKLKSRPDKMQKKKEGEMNAARTIFSLVTEQRAQSLTD
jgi:hypothetical protein